MQATTEKHRLEVLVTFSLSSLLLVSPLSRAHAPPPTLCPGALEGEYLFLLKSKESSSFMYLGAVNKGETSIRQPWDPPWAGSAGVSSGFGGVEAKMYQRGSRVLASQMEAASSWLNSQGKVNQKDFLSKSQ